VHGDVRLLGDRVNMVFKGKAVAQGSALAVAATAMATEMGAIATLLEATADEPTASVVMGTLFALSAVRSAAGRSTAHRRPAALIRVEVRRGFPASTERCGASRY
jgi:P-type Ca2+ transporter type 2C